MSVSCGVFAATHMPKSESSNAVKSGVGWQPIEFAGVEKRSVLLNSKDTDRPTSGIQ
jgi:hypothetical protein